MRNFRCHTAYTGRAPKRHTPVIRFCCVIWLTGRAAGMSGGIYPALPPLKSGMARGETNPTLAGERKCGAMAAGGGKTPALALRSGQRPRAQAGRPVGPTCRADQHESEETPLRRSHNVSRCSQQSSFGTLPKEYAPNNVLPHPPSAVAGESEIGFPHIGEASVWDVFHGAAGESGQGAG